MKFGLAIHGGAGALRREIMGAEREQLYTQALNEALNLGYSVLDKGGSSLDTVESVVKFLEDCPLFNAGRGSVFNSKGQHEMDASIMSGIDLKAGAVAMVSKVKNPIALARTIMNKSEYVFMAGAGAEEFAESQQLELVDEKYFFDQLRYEQWLKVKGQDEAHLDHNIQIEKKFGTVGAVALDKAGNLAAATSTGGMTNKRFGRIGDSPVIGAGTYANNKTCAISCTGHGEFFIRSVVAYDISCLMEYKGLGLKEACNEVLLNKMKTLGGTGGLIAIDTKGNIELLYNTDGMFRGLKSGSGEAFIGIYG